MEPRSSSWLHVAASWAPSWRSWAPSWLIFGLLVAILLPKMSQHSSNMSQDSPNSSQHRSKRPLRDSRNLDFHQISTFSCPSWRLLKLLQMHDFCSLQSIAPSLVDTFSIVSLQPILKLSATSALVNEWVRNCFDAYGLASLGAGGRGAALQSGVARQVLLRRVKTTISNSKV